MMNRKIMIILTVILSISTSFMAFAMDNTPIAINDNELDTILHNLQNPDVIPADNQRLSVVLQQAEEAIKQHNEQSPQEDKDIQATPIPQPSQEPQIETRSNQADEITQPKKEDPLQSDQPRTPSPTPPSPKAISSSLDPVKRLMIFVGLPITMGICYLLYRGATSKTSTFVNWLQRRTTRETTTPSNASNQNK